MALCLQGHPLRLVPASGKWICNVCQVNFILVKLALLSGFRIKSKNTNKVHRQNQHNSCNFFPKSEHPHVSPDVHVRCILKEVRLGDVGRTVVKEVEGAPADMTAAPTAWPNRG